MRYEVVDQVNFDEINYGSIIVLDDTLWTVILTSYGDKECLLVSLRTNEVIDAFDDFQDLVVYLKNYEIKRILHEEDFKIKIVEE